MTYNTFTFIIGTWKIGLAIDQFMIEDRKGKLLYASQMQRVVHHVTVLHGVSKTLLKFIT